jgi:hypothetical protein
MALVKATLKNGIKALLTNMRTKEEISDDEFADQLATLIDTYIKSATVTVAPGIAVSTAGSAAAQTGETTSLGTGTIS